MHAPSSSRLAALVALAALSSGAQAALPAGIGGAWFNPDQSGHGLTVEVLAPDRALVFWFVYDRHGNPMHLYMDGRIEGRRFEATALAPRGLRFPGFDRDAFAMPAWGEVSIDFVDCDRAVLRWDALAPEFGSGSTDLRRLTARYGSECVLQSTPAGPQGLVSARVERIGSGGIVAAAAPAIGAVDPQGRLWAIEQGSWPDQSPMLGAVGPAPCVALGSVEALETGEARARLRELPNAWSGPRLPHACDGGTWQGVASVEAGAVALRNSSSAEHRLWRFEPRAEAQLVVPLDLPAVAGAYEVGLRWQFGELRVPMQVEADGSVCVDLRQGIGEATQPCGLRGRIWAADAQGGFIDFELAADNEPHSAPYRGRGWMERRAEGDRLLLVGDNGARGIGLVAR